MALMGRWCRRKGGKGGRHRFLFAIAAPAAAAAAAILVGKPTVFQAAADERYETLGLFLVYHVAGIGGRKNEGEGRREGRGREESVGGGEGREGPT